MHTDRCNSSGQVYFAVGHVVGIALKRSITPPISLEMAHMLVEIVQVLLPNTSLQHARNKSCGRQNDIRELYGSVLLGGIKHIPLCWIGVRIATHTISTVHPNIESSKTGCLADRASSHWKMPYFYCLPVNNVVIM